MHITLDEEQWQLPDETSVMEVLAAISDKARAQHRIVTSLTIGGKAINDRDLIPAFLNQPVKGLGDARAASKSFHCIITEAKQAEDEIRQRNDELERFNKASVDRELRMVELKMEINELAKKLGEKPRYKIPGSKRSE